ncbi:MAG: asparagine synthase-related protein, partial [Pirellulaceae bacterium]|nr:asparagine synthase-related protein [Pirellulaceae bacterium]
DVLMDQTARDRGFFQNDSVARLIAEHIEGRFDHSHRLWALLVLELWLREWATTPIQSAAGSG